MAAPQVITSYNAVLGSVLRRLREERQLNLDAFAKASNGPGAAASSWSRVEKGEASITVEHLFAAASLLERTPSEILRLVEEHLIELAQSGITPGLSKSELAKQLAKVPLLLGVPVLGFLAVPFFGHALWKASKGSEAFARLHKAPSKWFTEFNAAVLTRSALGQSGDR